MSEPDSSTEGEMAEDRVVSGASMKHWSVVRHCAMDTLHAIPLGPGERSHPNDPETTEPALPSTDVYEFDNDTAGWNATERVGEMLSQLTVAWSVQCPFEGDPADLDDDAFEVVARDMVVPFSLWVRPDPEGSSLIGVGNGAQEVRNRIGDS